MNFVLIENDTIEALCALSGKQPILIVRYSSNFQTIKMFTKTRSNKCGKI